MPQIPVLIFSRSTMEAVSVSIHSLIWALHHMSCCGDKPSLINSKDAQRAALPQPMPHREQLAVLLIGSPEGVRENIHELHQRGYAEAGMWSGLLPAPNPGEVMSVLIRYRLVLSGDR
ncbi:MAG: hypothetical protein LH679_13625 [Cyanobacteria bacterium CAN_BIN43]|nr:hypothetical protein [Cyanobacteria bacterium CAN_BIN43]